jgi:hypothetical protein
VTGIYLQQQVRNEVVYLAGFGAGGAESQFRYTLSRVWGTATPDLFNQQPFPDRSGQHALFIMLNPSIADAFQDDPTVAKCMRLARRWGYEGVEVRNIFALRSTDPNGLRVCKARGEDPVGGTVNDTAIMSAVLNPRTGIIIAAWGNDGSISGRSQIVRGMLRQTGRIVYAFSISKKNEPEHPLYQPEKGVMPEHLVRFL